MSTPISRSTASEALRRIWYSLSLKVCAGATVIDVVPAHAMTAAESGLVSAQMMM